MIKSVALPPAAVAWRCCMDRQHVDLLLNTHTTIYNLKDSDLYRTHKKLESRVAVSPLGRPDLDDGAERKGGEGCSFNLSLVGRRVGNKTGGLRFESSSSISPAAPLLTTLRKTTVFLLRRQLAAVGCAELLDLQFRIRRKSIYQ